MKKDFNLVNCQVTKLLSGPSFIFFIYCSFNFYYTFYLSPLRTRFSAQFPYTDTIQIRFGLKKCLEEMRKYAKERSLKSDLFLEVYSSNRAYYHFLQWPSMLNWNFILITVLNSSQKIFLSTWFFLKFMKWPWKRIHSLCNRLQLMWYDEKNHIKTETILLSFQIVGSGCR